MDAENWQANIKMRVFIIYMTKSAKYQNHCENDDAQYKHVGQFQQHHSDQSKVEA